MSGYHNMNQKQPSVNNLQYRPGAEMQQEEVEQYKSQIERQCIEMQCAINLLKETVETLRKRLAPVRVDTPIRTASSEVSPVASPLGLSINQHRQQVGSVIDELAHIIESLEI